MKISPSYFRQILDELVEDNPIACRGMLGVCRVEFTAEVPTLAMTLSTPSVLKVNLTFMEVNAHNEDHVRSFILHEFLHVVLQHTFRYKEMSDLLNLALDTVINSTIHRVLGPRYSDAMSRFYATQKGLGRLLRPPTKEDLADPPPSLAARIHTFAGHLYSGGAYQTDEVINLCRELAESKVPVPGTDGPVYIGNHGRKAGGRDPTGELDPALRAILDNTLRSLKGKKGFCRNPAAVGTDYEAAALRQSLSDAWRGTTERALRGILDPRDGKGRPVASSVEAAIPILTPRDRRACVRQAWSPFLVESLWSVESRRGGGQTQVYLDVSGSMGGEIRELVLLLARFKTLIREPLWSFSDQVFPAHIADGRLDTRSTGGTNIDAVLRHLLATRPRCALIVTDGEVLQPNAKLLQDCADIRVHAIISPQGKRETLAKAGFPCFQLPSLPPS